MILRGMIMSAFCLSNFILYNESDLRRLIERAIVIFKTKTRKIIIGIMKVTGII